MKGLRAFCALVVAMGTPALLGGCRGATPASSIEHTTPVATPTTNAAPAVPTSDGTSPAPWRATPLAPAAVPRVFMQVWAAAENRDRCPLLVPTWLGAGANAQPEPTMFTGGWGVDYKQPDLCADCIDSAFGVAGVGGSVDSSVDDGWEQHVAWADGSHADYGPEGHSGPGWIAYLFVEGAGCNYNVWSNVSEQHLLQLMASLHAVAR